MGIKNGSHEEKVSGYELTDCNNIMTIIYSFQSLKNELHLRHTLERQSVHLHHATVGYAVSHCILFRLYTNNNHTHIQSTGRAGRESVHIPVIPDPSVSAWL